MKLENSFTVDAPLDRTWATLLDIERVAGCLPGATIEPGGDEGVYRGTMKVKLGPMTVDYTGTAQLQDVDEDTHTASIAVQAREAKGQGTAAAVIRNQLEPQNGGTRVLAVTDLKITGRQAQFGRGIMEDVAGTMMAEFAKRLEAEIASPAAAAGQPFAEREEGEALDLGGVLASTPMVRYAGIGALALVVALALAVILGRRGGHTLNVNLRR
jgi:carbon monoxide dehydrogenase subunit G